MQFGAGLLANARSLMLRSTSSPVLVWAKKLSSSLSDFAKQDAPQAGRASFFVLAIPSKEIGTPKLLEN